MVGLQAAIGMQTMSSFLKLHLAVEFFYISFTMKKGRYAPITRLSASICFLPLSDSENSIHIHLVPCSTLGVFHDAPGSQHLLLLSWGMTTSSWTSELGPDSGRDCSVVRELAFFFTFLNRY